MNGHGLPALRVDDAFLERLADRLADTVAGKLADRDDADDGYLDAETAARYMGLTRKRVHDLTSTGALIPDGRDGRKPLYRRSTLDRYLRGGVE